MVDFNDVCGRRGSSTTHRFPLARTLRSPENSRAPNYACSGVLDFSRYPLPLILELSLYPHDSSSHFVSCLNAPLYVLLAFGLKGKSLLISCWDNDFVCPLPQALWHCPTLLHCSLSLSVLEMSQVSMMKAVLVALVMAFLTAASAQISEAPSPSPDAGSGFSVGASSAAVVFSLIVSLFAFLKH
ncbi:hypothetical protein V6N12_055679 [Hibiscus sabdariffa]|uniref:Uncharacterized protein n=1 Tax=Hibiscus sabdariffa TaxID=183260 RepID=A0ABR2AMD1_9ROSI